MDFTAILIASFIVGPGAVVLAHQSLRLPEGMLQKLTPRILSLATGAILGTVFLHTLPQALEKQTPGPLLATVLAAILAFFLSERLQLLRHCHQFHCPEHGEMASNTFLGNALQNLVAGMALTTVFQASLSSGWIMTLALLGHEIPKAMVSLTLLKDGKANAVGLLWNLTASVFLVAGGLMAWLTISWAAYASPFPVAAGSAFFLYIAFSDLLPRQRGRLERREAMLQAAFVLSGAGLLWLLPRCG